MPKRKTHARVGLIGGLGAAVLLLYAWYEGLFYRPFFYGARQLDLGLLLFVGPGAAWLGSHVPDLLEPSTKGPSHRRFFHSVVFMLLLFVLLYAVATGYLLDGATREGFYLRIVLVFSGLGYLSHVVADMFSPGRIPLY